MNEKDHVAHTEEWGRVNLKRLVAEHKRNCNDPNCNISLLSIRIWLEKLGVKFTKEEEGLFI